MNKRITRIVGVAGFSLSIAACSNTIYGGPARIHNVIANDKDNYSELHEAIKEACFNPSSETVDRVKRNNIVHGYMLLADRRYNRFEAALLNENRGGNFLASTLSLGLSTAGSLASEGAAQTLTTIDGGLKGATQSFGKEFLFNQTVTALISQMRASRAEQKVRINQGLITSSSSWTLCEAMQNLTDYEQAGTLTSAITRLTATAVDDKNVQEEKERRSDASRFERSPLQDVLTEYLDPSLEDDEYSRRNAILVKALQTVDPSRSPYEIMSLHASSSADLKQMILEAHKLETDAKARKILELPAGA